MWASWMEKYDQCQKRYEKAKESGMTVEKVEAMELKEKMKEIESLKALSADSVKEYISLREKWESINENEEFHQWVEKNKETINDLLSYLFNVFAMERKKSISFKYTETETGYVIFKDKILIETFLLKILRENGYYYSISYHNKNKSAIKIMYRLEDI